LSALTFGIVTAVKPIEVKADNIITLNSVSGIKSKQEKIGLNLTQLKENRIVQIDFTKIKEEKKELQTKDLTLEELKEKKAELEEKSYDVTKTIDSHKETISKKAIEKTVAQNKVEEIKEVVEDKTKETTNSTPTTVALNYPTKVSAEPQTAINNNIENKNKENKQEEAEKVLEEVSKEVVAKTQEKANTELKVKEQEVQLQEIKTDKSKIEEAIKAKEEEIARKKAEEEAKKKAEEEARIAAEKAAIKAKTDYTANAVRTVSYSGSTDSYTWLSPSDPRIKDSDFDAPSVQATQTGYSGNAYALGQCTWYVYNRIAQIGKSIDPYFGNGGDWNDTAPGKGYTVTNTPVAGSAVCFEGWHGGGSSVYGHVGFVEHVYPDGTFLISEMNVGGEFSMAWRIMKNGPGLSFILPK